MLLNESDIELLLRQQPITDEWPWNTKNETTICQNIREVIALVCRKLGLKDKSEFGHYGSGYASFVDCWLYREDAEFRFATGDCYWGLVVLFSTLSKYFVLGEGQKTWHATGGTSYLPSLEFVDKIVHPAVAKLEGEVCNILAERGLIRVHAGELSDLLPRDVTVPTILSDPPWHYFDAVYYWED